MGVRVTQEGVETLVSGSPAARVTQEAGSFLVEGSPKARVTQEGMSALVAGVPKARITQEALVFLYLPGVFGSSADTEEFYFIRRPQVNLNV